MNKVAHRHFETWAEFKAFITEEVIVQECGGQAGLLFRGHSSIRWKLEASFDRWYRDLELTGNRFELAKRLVRNFADLAKAFNLPVPEKEELRTAYAQHYGVPTRMLDWSRSPYVAAFFAFDGGRGDEHVAIWALNRNSDAWHPEMGAEIVTPDPDPDNRLRSQNAAFSILRAPVADLEDYLNAVSSAQIWPALHCYSLPRKEAVFALRDLALMGIDNMTLFGGLEGCAKVAISKILFEKDQQHFNSRFCGPSKPN